MNKRDNVYHLINDAKNGCCVLVGNLLITAGHLINDDGIYLQIKGSRISLKREDAIILFEDSLEKELDGHERDIAIFKLDDFSSPLELDDKEVEVGDILESISYRSRAVKIENPVKLDPKIYGVFGGDHYVTVYDEIITSAKVDEVGGGYFSCNTDVMLKPGSSGSPIFNGDKVAGILVAGSLGTNNCVFMSSRSILNLINSNE